MSRPRAGHLWTSISQKNGKHLHLITNDAGFWITTGEAKDWRRCPRCRRPFEADPFSSGLCPICYFYKSNLPLEKFWRLYDEGYYLHPCRAGERSMKHYQSFDLNLVQERKSALKPQYAQS